MNNKLSNEEINIYKKFLDDSKCSRTHLTSPREIIVLDKALTELLAYREAESEPVAYLTWHQGMRAIDDCEEYMVVAEKGDKSDGGSPAFPVYASPVLSQSVPDEREAFNQWNNDIDCPLAGLDTKTAAWKAWSHRAAVLSTSRGQPALNPIAPNEIMPEGLIFSSSLPEFEGDSNKIIGYHCFLGAYARLVSTQEQAYTDAKAVCDHFNTMLSASPVLGQTPESINAELLHALLELACVARRYLPDYDEHPEIQQADAAIAKATGETK